jgi:hypothetical protein
MKTAFRRLAFLFLAGLVFSAGLATAQVITRSIQLTQDPSGPFGVDANNNLYLTANRHLNAVSGASGGTPSLGTCTGGAITAGSTDLSGQVTGASAATCAVVFGQAYGTAPRCLISLGTTNAGPIFVSAVTTAGFTINQAATASTYNWVCMAVS